jgi:hypothetical protein
MLPSWYNRDGLKYFNVQVLSVAENRDSHEIITLLCSQGH